MRQHQLYSIGSISLIDVVGSDADAIVHNVTTNEIRGLSDGHGRETFITDVRGKTLGHVLAFRIDGVVRLIGPAGQSERISEHLDRYTIREDAIPTVRDGECDAVVVMPDLASQLGLDSSEEPELASVLVAIGGEEHRLYGCHWLGRGSGVLLLPAGKLDSYIEALSQDESVSCGDLEEFQAARTRALFPWYGIDVTDANLPQEADRDRLAVSFTKGCYLGQETVARLDALGKVQKKLVTWSIPDGIPSVGDAVLQGEKTVGRLTSVAPNGQGGAIALGPARRSHFDAGAEGVCHAEGQPESGESGEGLRAVVL